MRRAVHAKSIFGAERVVRVLASVAPSLVRIDVRLEPREVNGQPGAIFRDRDGNVLATLTLDVADGQIQTVRSVSNPDKLGHLGRVGDAWAVAREVNQAHAAHSLTCRPESRQYPRECRCPPPDWCGAPAQTAP